MVIDSPFMCTQSNLMGEMLSPTNVGIQRQVGVTGGVDKKNADGIKQIWLINANFIDNGITFIDHSSRYSMSKLKSATFAGIVLYG